MHYKVIIPTAGLGTRLGNISNNINKSLVTITGKPVISHIIEKFPLHVPIVIALGYKGELIKEFLELAYPERTFEFADVDKYEGEGSGLGYSLLMCSDFLQCPFVFCSCDTIVEEQIPNPDSNWIGYSGITENLNHYRTIKLIQNEIIDILEKGVSTDNDVLFPYIGLAGINNYKLFWESMSRGFDNQEYLIGEVYGLRGMLADKMQAFKFSWHDTGNLNALIETRKRFFKEGEPNVLEKDGEAIWFINDNVIKFSIDEDFIKSRVIRSKILKGYVPKVINNTKHMYSYTEIKGKVLSEVINLPLFHDFLQYSKQFWKVSAATEYDEEQFFSACKVFYKDKTLKRINQYFEKHGKTDGEEFINGYTITTINNLLDQIDWEYLSNGLAGRYHGDFHFENIVLSENNRFWLLDWRQDFGGLFEIGDIYYDLAKLNHGLIISHDLILKNQFNININDNNISFDFNRKNILIECEKAFRKFIINNEYDLKKVDILTALIFLNISPLHHVPYSHLLFYLGKYMLHKINNLN